MAKKNQNAAENNSQATEPQAEKLNRNECANRVVKDWLAGKDNGDTTLTELAEQADMLFLAGHPNAEPDVDTAEWAVQAILEQLETLDLVVLEWHCGVSPKGKLNGGAK